MNNCPGLTREPATTTVTLGSASQGQKENYWALVFFGARIYGYKSSKRAIAVKRKAKPRIAYLREKAGLTQLELSRLVGVTESTIQNWESGRTGTDHIDRIVRFCQALNCRVEELIEYVGESREEPTTAKPNSLSDIHNLLGTDETASSSTDRKEVLGEQNTQSQSNIS